MSCLLNNFLTIIILVLCVEGNNENRLEKEHVSNIPNIDHILVRLTKEDWDPEEVLCRNKIYNILENVRNSTLWATWVWNSIEQAPTGLFFGARYHMGAYDQCLRPPWLSSHPELLTQYCLAEIEMNGDGVKTMEQVTDPYVRAEDYYLDTQTQIGRSFSYFAHGVCLPAVCPSKSAEKFVRALLSTGYLRAARGAAVSIHHCEQAGAPHQYTTGYYVFIFTFATLLFIAVASTYYVSEYPASASTDSFINTITKSFCIRRNYSTLVKESTGELTFLHGIRFIMAVLIAFMHLLGGTTATSVSNALDVDLMSMQHIKSYFLMHGDVFTDTFFVMSALLLGRGLATMDIKDLTFNTLLKLIVLRYLRVLGALAVAVLYMAHVSMHTDDGPIYPVMAKLEQQACEKNWWITLLMVGNYFNTSEMCHPVTWYVTCDCQLFVTTLIIFYVYRESPRVGKATAATALAIGFLGSAMTVYVRDLPAVLIYNVKIDINVRKNKLFTYAYYMIHNRIGAYMAGLTVGYFMSVYKPENHKKIWSKTKSFLGFGVCLAIMAVVLAVGCLCFRYHVHGFLASVYVTFDRITFAIAFLGFIIICTYGDLSIITSFLNWSVFAPLSRLAYGVYLIHPLIIYRSKSSLRSHMKHHLFDMFTESLGIIVVSLVLSLAVWLLVEAPLMNIIGLKKPQPAKKLK